MVFSTVRAASLAMSIKLLASCTFVIDPERSITMTTSLGSGVEVSTYQGLCNIHSKIIKKHTKKFQLHTHIIDPALALSQILYIAI